MNYPNLSPFAARAMTATALCVSLATAVVLGASPVLAAQASSASKVEAHLQDMHAKLQITPEQEVQWKPVAQTMRDNDAAMAPIIEQRKSAASTMTAVEDLKSYGQIASVHAEGIKNFTVVFEALYDTMSESQKKDADALFRNGFPKMAKAR